MLTEKPGEIISHRDLFARVWPNVIVEEANLRVHIATLRKALGEGGDEARYVANISGRGYAFVADVTAANAVPSFASKDNSTLPETVDPYPLRAVDGLPPRLARMVGRDETVDVIAALLAEHRFVSIIGAGGMGKTTVAVSVAHFLLDDFDGQVVFVDLAALNDPALVAIAVGSAIGLPLAPHDPLAGLLAYLSDKRLLLILDNCEHVIDAAAHLAERLHAAATELHILTTSRESLRVEGEMIHLLLSLEGPTDVEGLTAARALQTPAVRLFMERAAASGHIGDLTDKDAAAVAEICRKLDGLPLALELAAGRVGAHGIAGTIDLLAHRFRLSWQGRRTSLPRHQTLHAMLDWSFDLLSQNDGRILRRLSVFVGPFTIEAAQDVASDHDVDAADVAGTLETLVDKSLIWSVTSQGQALFRLPDTTRAYLHLKLAANSETIAVARRHALHVSHRLGAVTLARAVLDTRQAAESAPQIGNIRAALEWSFSPDGDGTIAVELAVKTAPLFLALPLLPECLRWCTQGLTRLSDTQTGTELEVALQLGVATSAMFSQGNGDLVRRAIDRGLILAKTLGAHRQRLHLMAGLHIFLSRTGSTQEAFAVSLESLDIARNLDDPAAQIIADWMAGCSYHLMGQQELAQHHCDIGFDLASRHSDLKLNFFGYDHRIRALIVTARILWLRGEPERAEQAGRTAIAEAELGGQPVSVCIALIYTATVLLWNGDVSAAKILIDRLIGHAERYRLGPYRAVGLALRGELLTVTGEPSAGAELLSDCLTSLKAEQHLVLAPGAVRAMAEAMAATDRVEAAVALLDAELDQFHRPRENKTVDVADLLRARAEIELLRPAPDRQLVEAMLQESISLARAQSALSWELRTTIALTRYHIGLKSAGKAREQLAAMIAQFPEGLVTSDLMIAGQLVGQAADKPAPRLHQATVSDCLSIIPGRQTELPDLKCPRLSH